MKTELDLLNASTQKKSVINTLKFEISYWINSNILIPIRGFMRGVDNLIKWRRIIFNDRWWDYSYLLEIELFKLKDMEKHWGVDTHYVNDLDDKEILKKLIEDLEWMIDSGNEFDKEYEKEYKKRARSFYGRLERNHRKLWD